MGCLFNCGNTDCLLKYRDHILAEDLQYFLNAKHAAEAFDMLDDDKDGKASLKDVRAAVCTIFRWLSALAFFRCAGLSHS